MRKYKWFATLGYSLLGVSLILLVIQIPSSALTILVLLFLSSFLLIVNVMKTPGNVAKISAVIGSIIFITFLLLFVFARGMK